MSRNKKRAAGPTVRSAGLFKSPSPAKRVIGAPFKGYAVRMKPRLLTLPDLGAQIARHVASLPSPFPATRPVHLEVPRPSKLHHAFRKGSLSGKDHGRLALSQKLPHKEKTTGVLPSGKGARPLERAAKRQEPERAKSLKTRDVKNCKERPDPVKARSGSGGSRDFIPWCDGKK